MVLGEARGACSVDWRLALSSIRLAVSDIVSEGGLPEEIKCDTNAWAGRIAGALEQQEYLEKIKGAGFKDVQVLCTSKEFHLEGEGSQALTKLLSITVKAYKGA